MQTKHYIVKNIAEFSNKPEAIEKLKEYLSCIEEIAFPAIEEVFGQKWSDGQINIKLNNSESGAKYYYDKNSRINIIKMGINNKNIQKEYPENLWGCLFHETHHAFLNQIIHNKRKRDGKILNAGHKAEVFNYAFMATTYLKLKEKNKINTQVYKYFLSELERGLDKHNKKFRNSNKDELKFEKELLDNAMDIFCEYKDLFFMNIKNFAKFISYIKSSDSVFMKTSNFRQDLNKAEEFLTRVNKES